MNTKPLSRGPANRARVFLNRLVAFAVCSLVPSAVHAQVTAKASPAASQPVDRQKAAPAKRFAARQAPRQAAAASKPKSSRAAAGSAPASSLTVVSIAESPYTKAAESSIGSISVGSPHAGFLINAVPLPDDPRWGVSVPQHRYGTEETVEALTRAIAFVHERFPGSPQVMIGSLSPKGGGYAPPHKSHRTGRDVDVYFYRVPGSTWFVKAKKEDIDFARSWALLKAFLTQTEIDYVLLDKTVQGWFREYAASIGEDPLWLAQVFEGEGRYPNPAIKHVPGHANHFHVRFASPLARERGRLLYDRLVLQGHVRPPARGAKYVVEPGETLADIASRYGTTEEALRRSNSLKSNKIRGGQRLIVPENGEVVGVRDPVRVARIPKPEEKASQVADTLAALSALESAIDRSLSEAAGDTTQSAKREKPNQVADSR